MSWYFENGPEADVVVSSRIRFARNIHGRKFTGSADEEELKEILKTFKGNKVVSGLKFIQLNDLDELMRMSLVEKHIISRDVLRQKNAAMLLNADEDACVMLNEEDHIRIQTMTSGFDLDKAYKEAKKIDNQIAEKVEYAFSDLYGYLTMCPTNLGTGMRASVMLHLPALRMTGQIGKVIDVVNKINLNVRGVYGEGTDAIGDMYQVSNKVSLGLTDEEIINNVTNVVNKIIAQERNAREYLKNRAVEFEDKICRDFGTLSCARKLSYKESEQLISIVRLGVHMGLIKEIDAKKVNEISVVTKPATLQKFSKETLEGTALEMKRAEMIKKIIKK